MRFLSVVIVAIVMACSCIAAEDVAVKIDTEVLSKYVFRGQLASEEPVLQSTLSVQKGIFELKVFGNMDLDENGSQAHNDNTGEPTEYNIDFGFDKRVWSGNGIVKGVNVLGGLVYFSYPNTDREATVETYIGTDTEFVKGIHVKTQANIDLNECAGGWYWQEEVYKDFRIADFGLFGKPCKLVAKPNLGMGGGSAEYNRYYWGLDEFITTDWYAGLAVVVESERFEFGPSVKYTDLVNDDLRDQTRDPEHVVFGFGAAVKF